MTISDLRTALENKDQKSYTAMFAENIEFFSPVEAEPVRGKEIVGQLLGLVFEILQDFHYTEQLETENLSILVFEAKINGLSVEGVDLIRFDCQGLVKEFTVIIRPMNALQALAEEVAMRLKLIMSQS